ncbi:hypothetical protein EJB05_50588 [Eragrostis curvula]|uniref:Uncharacterized protein n=1 Tax=Eragrostis curvula TaxID=38414 RepID=A0A5J9SXV5_9POAL|nr:hypothetical protein EJB05_50588 [Eragrostis curvula]
MSFAHRAMGVMVAPCIWAGVPSSSPRSLRLFAFILPPRLIRNLSSVPQICAGSCIGFDVQLTEPCNKQIISARSFGRFLKKMGTKGTSVIGKIHDRRHNLHLQT